MSLRFGEKCVLDHVTLGVQPQERLVIIGQSGAGKTTILRLVLGILAPTAGSVFFQQQDIARLTPPELQQIRRHIGMVYQDGALILTAPQIVALLFQRKDVHCEHRKSGATLRRP